MKQFRSLPAVLLFFLLITSLAHAALPHWQIQPDSSITFTGTQNNAPVSGQFKTFSGDIYFDPAQLDKSSVEIKVDMNSVTSSYEDIADTLRAPDWFNVKLFPQAIFKTQHITKTGDNTYQATGTLTIRDKTVPITLDFSLKDYSANKTTVIGTTTLKRIPFGVGQGEWSDTNAVKDEVKVDFSLSAVVQ
jgi:polyisoprenoid-binding protein YceI